jgi:hypothetical protein
MPDGRLRNLLLVVSSVLLVAGVIAAVTTDDSATTTSALRSADGTTTTVAASETTVAGETTTTTAAGEVPAATIATSPSTTTAPSAAPAARELAATAEPPANRPPKAGAYRLRATFDGEARELTATVEDRGADGPVVKQLITLETQEGTIANDFEWRPDGAYATRSKLTFGSVTADCDWNPDLLQVRLPLRKGVEYTADSSCATSVFGQPATIKATSRAKVMDAKRVEVPAGTFDVWVIEGSSTLTFTSPQATITQEETSTTWYAPGIGSTVRESGTAKASSGQRSQERQYDMELIARPA